MSLALDTKGVFPGFENVSRFWDNRQRCYVVKVKPGEYYVSGVEEPITTTLGSCIAVCVRDVRLGVGGMNHFMLPGSERGNAISGCARYGNYAMEHLVNTLLGHGSYKSDLEFKVFGGGAVLQSDTLVGDSNIAFLKEFMAKESYPILSEDLGGAVARRVMYYPVSGRAMLKHINTDKNAVNEIIKEEEDHLRSLCNKHEVIGDIELF